MPGADGRYTPAELRVMLGRMDQLAKDFYGIAFRIGCHPFIEFTGLMTEYCKLCDDALKAGVDFTETSVHGNGSRLPMAEHHRKYLSEKLECIYGVSLEALMKKPEPEPEPEESLESEDSIDIGDGWRLLRFESPEECGP